MGKGLLLDVDGVILDSSAAYETVWELWSTGHGLDPMIVLAATHGRRPVDTIEEVAPQLDPMEEYERLQLLVADPALAFPPMEGASDFLSSLPMNRWGLVTSGDVEKVRARFERGSLPVPDIIVDGQSVRKGKPAPDCYQRGALLLAVRTDQCLVLEDAPAGIRSARDAGCKVLGIASTHHRDSLSEAHVLVDNLMQARAIVADWFLR